MQVGVALLFSVAAGILWSRMLRILSEQRFWQVLTFSIVLVLYAGMEALGANGLIAVLGFGLTLSNFPGVEPSLGLTGSVTAMAESQQQLLTFHSELAFLVRTFFFVLIGAVADLDIFLHHPLLTAGVLGALFLARWLAVQSSRWAWSEIGEQGREAILWMLPRGLITVVLAIEVAEARPQELSFLPGLAFAAILATNLLVVIGSWRAQRSRATAAAAPTKSSAEADAAENEPGSPEPPPPTHHHRRWVFNLALLVLLAFSGLVLWAGNQPANSRAGTAKKWIQSHLRR
jgi:NhaP-type Na+/H+ or K+/H+ antiporter